MGGGCSCAGGNSVRLASEPLLSLVLTCLRHQDDQKVMQDSHRPKTSALTCDFPCLDFVPYILFRMIISRVAVQ